MKLKEIKAKIEDIKSKTSSITGSSEEISILQTEILYGILRALRRLEATIDRIENYLP